MLPTPPSTHTSRSTSPVCPGLGPDADLVGADTSDIPSAGKKKKKKKPKKAASKAREETNGASASGNGNDEERDRPPVLCISRNKHWRYISSYHGPWLQLPLELLESLLVLNLDPATLSAADAKLPPLTSHSNSSYTNGYGHSHNHLNGHSHAHQKQRDRGFASLADYSPPDSPRNSFAALPPPAPFPSPPPGKATPPPIDPGVFRSVTHIRRLIDEAAELSVRASSGLSAAALGSHLFPL
uniref:CifA n=1 Tax=Ganoderma boninense TaxID=34458 RepID=A0A5K1K582_9APHY|nr:CifA [Ganoderma boninense]